MSARQDVHKEFIQAVGWLEGKGVSGITGDCGFMMAFQPLASEIASVPVFMSSMMQCPMISIAFDKYDKILILTANDARIGTLLKQCGFDVDDRRFMIMGCQNVPGFDAVAKGEKVDVEYVTPGIVYMVKQVLKKHASVRAILLECTELPPYADALRAETKLPVFDAITNADPRRTFPTLQASTISDVQDFFISARRDNPRFGFNQWQLDWDGTQDEYEQPGSMGHLEKIIRVANQSPLSLVICANEKLTQDLKFDLWKAVKLKRFVEEAYPTEFNAKALNREVELLLQGEDPYAAMATAQEEAAAEKDELDVKDEGGVKMESFEPATSFSGARPGCGSAEDYVDSAKVTGTCDGHVGSMHLPHCVLNVIMAVLGAGQLTLPYAMKLLGLPLGFFSLCFFTVLSMHSVKTLSIHELEFTPSGQCLESYSELVTRMMGISGSLLCQLLLVAYAWGGAVAFLVILKEQFQFLFHNDLAKYCGEAQLANLNFLLWI
eukprot:g15850.t1